MSSTDHTNNDLSDDLMMFTMDPLNTLDEEDESSTHRKSDLSTSDYHSFLTTATNASLMVESSPFTLMNQNKKMFDITELLGSSPFDEKQDIFNWPESVQPVSSSSPSLSITEYLRAQALNHEQDIQWQMEQEYLIDGSKQISPSDYLNRQSLYNRPVAFEKDSRTWARSLLNNMKKPSNKSAMNCSLVRNSPPPDHHHDVEQIDHFNEYNDYPRYLDYINESRPQLFYSLTDSLDIIDGLLGTVVSSF